ncbi:MAG: helix-turn-helix transcriptional regulator [Clostridia bacterium]|nr:helix-turn-helix transcriptional regulator [Clostridia bacterium]MBQ4608418.1 helix-turn-helix transcriptional regulator [Clostridia bacterium]MBQ6857828.1 helix-turn-helix transcriptional regulator [Clostridia bacterium]MBQ7051945.1 helix-turn-helix transcriptional regulator [Clostridia bacterium]
MFYHTLYVLCKEHGTTITALARELNIAKGSPSNWQRGASPNSDVVMKIARHFGVSCDYLLGMDDVPSRLEEFSLTQDERELITCLRSLPPKVYRAVSASVSAFASSLEESAL